MDAGQSITRLVGFASPATVRLDISRLKAVAKELCDTSLVSSSTKTYKSAQKIFVEFCHSCGRPPLPASEQLLILFVAYLANRVCYSTARTYLAAIQHLHIAQGHGDPLKGCSQLELVLKVLKGHRPRAQDSRLPITPFKSVLDRNSRKYDSLDGLLPWFLCVLAVNGIHYTITPAV